MRPPSSPTCYLGDDLVRNLLLLVFTLFPPSTVLPFESPVAIALQGGGGAIKRSAMSTRLEATYLASIDAAGYMVAWIYGEDETR